MIELDRYVLEITAPLHLANRGGGLESTESTIRSDTLFSALCHGIAATRGPAAVDDLFEWFREGLAPFALSSCFPWGGEVFLFPRPRIVAPGGGRERGVARRARWVTQSVLEELLVDGGPDCPDGPDALLAADSGADAAIWTSVADRRAPIPEPPWWRQIKVPRVTIDRETQASALFHVKRTVFQPSSGLYFLVHWRDWAWKDAFEEALAFLADSGFGGERSAGHGQFRLRAHDRLAITPAAAPNRRYTLGLYHPTIEEISQGVLDDARFDLEVRRGWMIAPTGASLWRRSVRMLAEGALIGPAARAGSAPPATPDAPGSLVEVTPHRFSAHRVFRYGIALTLDARAPLGLSPDSAGARDGTR